MASDASVDLAAGQELDGFAVRAVTPVPDQRAAAIELEHLATGAKVLHVYVPDDDENLFSVSFPTPPPDDTGLPHILEHCVLAGSKSFPVRDPFFEMIKMSMATFLNAMTGFDCTYYPVASNVKADLFNLAQVYFDAVFHPLLTEETFQREGHHLAPADPEDALGALTVNGIVYNEMKGAFSDPQQRLYREAGRGLFPDTQYGRESGGDPESIPELTYEQFVQFHRRHYHPSNALFVLYGNIPTSEYAAFLAPRLADFQRQDFTPVIDRQPHWPAPRRIEAAYPVGPDEPLTEKTYIAMDWLLADATDAAHAADLLILSNVLVGNEGAPLKKAIITSKLGEDLLHAGGAAFGCETIFQLALKGSEPDRTEAFETLVTDTLKQIADEGVDRTLIEAAFQQAAYHYREIQSMHPLHMMMRVMEAWTYDHDPLTFLQMNEHLADCRRRWLEDDGTLGRLIHTLLLDNPHRLTVTLAPDRQWQEAHDQTFAERMAGVRAELTDEQARALAERAEELDEQAGTPNTPEQLASLPQLRVADVPAELSDIPTTVEELSGGAALLNNDVFANGVAYLSLSFDLTGLPADLWPWLGAYADAVEKLGAAGMDYEQVARRMSAYTGGIHCQPLITTHYADPGRSIRRLQIGMKALDENLPRALDLLADLLFAVDPRDADRLRDVLTQARAHYRTDLLHRGAWTAMGHAERGLSVEGHLHELVSGLPQLALAEESVGQFDQRSEQVMARIETVRDFLLNPARLAVSFTGSDTAAATVRTALGDWIARMTPGEIADADVGYVPFDSLPREGLAGPIQVAHCARVMPAVHASDPREALLRVGAHLVNLEYMIPEVRFRGNAYGAWCRYSPLGRTIALGSYEDPHVKRTLGVFAGAAEFVENAPWAQADVDRAIIATAKNDAKPIRPGSATELALQRHLTGITSEIRRKRNAALKAARADEVRQVTLDALREGLAGSAVCVVSSRDKLEQANAQLGEESLSIEDIVR